MLIRGDGTEIILKSIYTINQRNENVISGDIATQFISYIQDLI